MMKSTEHQPDTRKLLVRITRATPRRNAANELVMYVTYSADGGEVFDEQFVLDRDFDRLEDLRAAVGWWATTLTGEKVGLILDSDGTILGSCPAVQLDPLAVNLFPWSLLCPGRFRRRKRRP